MNVHFKMPVEASDFDAVFLQQYEKIQRWAMLIAKNDRELAKDLVHDVYLRFTLTEQNPSFVENIDNYIYVALKNQYFSHLRRSIRTKPIQFSVVEQEIINSTALAFDPRHTNKIHDQLRVICHYACLRKATSIGASILILRFFHGYFPSEVALILKRSLNAIEARLKTSRLEVAGVIAYPERLAALTKKNNCFRRGAGLFESDENILSELRRKVFSSRRGDCQPIEKINDFYARGRSNLPRIALSHMVSCESCLDNINLVLNMPRLQERHPLDMLGRETKTNVALKSNYPVENKVFAASGGGPVREV